ncbi:MAG: helix-turn-helix transcriptional regulator [Planctomycetes bacterium]|nr:helix-turn-helix transcriptional regulator [Planctomycetota bacterium]
MAGRMEIDPPALFRLETGKMLNPTLATLHKWAEALGQKLDVDLSSRMTGDAAWCVEQPLDDPNCGNSQVSCS